MRRRETSWATKCFGCLHCPPFSFIWFPPLQWNMSVVFARIMGFDNCFVSGSLVQTRVGKFTHPPPNVVHLLWHVWPQSNTGMQRTLQVLQFPFDVSRSNMLLHTPLLVVTFLVHRYRWRDSGIFVFLPAEDQHSVSATNWAAWNEYMERCSDDLFDGSPHLGVVVPQLRLQRA